MKFPSDITKPVKRIFHGTTPEFIFGLALSAIAIAHLPERFVKGAFDRSAAPQFITLAIVAIVTSIYLLFVKSWDILRWASWTLFALLLSVAISTWLSDSFYASLIGDTGRYVGVTSFVALLTIALCASTFDLAQFERTLLGAGIGILSVTVLGGLQSFEIISLPTGGGAGSTLGNLDFLSAWIGTTLIFAYVILSRFSFPRLAYLIYAITALTTLFRIDAKQGYVDLIVILTGLGLFLLAQKIRLFKLSTLAWKILATFALLAWSEIIYLVTVAQLPIPGISGDANVSIRADFWFSAAQMFFQHIGFGVGPDNYGNYYEKFRSLNSVQVTETVLANDAHSAMMQTLATLGIFATIAFFILFMFSIFSLIDLYKRDSNKIYLAFILALVVFYTNSLISPITLPNKALFWALCGFAIGQGARMTRSQSPEAKSQKRPALIVMSLVSMPILIFGLYSFLPGYLKINGSITQAQLGEKVNYQVTSTLPCIAYSPAQIDLAVQSGIPARTAAEEILQNYPRCLDALAIVVQDHFAKRDFKGAKPHIYQLLDVAPARQSVVRLAAIYALETNDTYLKNLLTNQGFKLGLIKPNQLDN